MPHPGAARTSPPPPAGAARARARSWFSYQANVTGRGIVASYSARFWLIVAMVGVIAGAGASALVGLLHLVEHLAFGYRSGPFLDGVAAAASWRRVAALVVAAGVVAVGVYVLGRLPVSGGTEVAESVWLRGAHMSVIQSVARAVLSIITVGLGVSLGREGAPQLVGAAGASRLADWGGLPTWQRRLLVASGAGAGFAAVYNVPLGGTLFALEVLLGTLSLPLVLPALATSVIATCVAWIFLGTSPTYRLPSYAVHPQQLAWAALAGPIIGAVAILWVRIIAWAGTHRPTGRGRYIAPLVVFLILGLVSIQYPELLGNGKGVVQLAAVGSVSFGLLWVLFALKPLATAACLWTGSPGGLFTPSLTIGALLASILGYGWLHLFPGARLGSYAIIGGGAFLAASMQGPLSGVVLVLELTRNFDSLMAPTLLAVVEATVIARRLGAPSIYSARLRPDPDELTARSPGGAAIDTLERVGSLSADADPSFDSPDAGP
ncbi:MAG TPA: chloride channel protein [Solirubrobacteraceae bacterium]|nr:chloride channel protein [Solirubrobacteraceae bacterium]